MSARIVTVLPPREGFSPSHAGAVALCVKDFTEASRYRDQTIILGGIADGFAGFDYRSMPAKRWWQRRSRAYARFCLAQSYEAALIEIHNRPGLFLTLSDATGTPLALHLHNDPQEMTDCRTALQRQKLLDRAAAVYCVSDYIRRRFCDGVTHGLEKVHTVHNGLAPVIPADNRCKQIIFVGRLKPEKGALELAEALAHFLPRHPEWQAVFIGGGRHRPGETTDRYSAKLHAVLQPVASQVRFSGYCTHAQTMAGLSRSEIAVVPSKWNEPFGRTALEAMVSGAALIASPFGGLAEVIGDAALHLTNVSGSAIDTALERLASDSELRRNVREHGLRQAKHFAIDTVTAKLDAIRTTIIAPDSA